MYRTILYMTAIFLLAVAGIVTYYSSALDDREISEEFVTHNVQKGDVIETVSATGTLNPVNTVKVGSQISGIIEQLNVDFNSTVKQGDLIAKIESSMFKAQAAQAKANLQSASAVADKASLTFRDTQRTVERLRKLYEEKAITISDLDAAQYNSDAAEVEKRVKQAAIAQAKAALEQAKVNLNYTNIYAPIDGLVISRDVDVGQTVAASLQAPTLFTIAKDLTQMQIEAEVDEAYIGKIQEGQHVDFNVFAFPKRNFKGVVVQIRLNPKVEASVVKYNCIIHVKNSDMALKPGMTATVAIETQRSNNVLFVPNSALRYVPQWPAEKLDTLRKSLKKGQAIVWKVTDEKLVPVKVYRGLVGETGTEIISDKITSEMKVAVPDKKNQGQSKRKRRISLF